MAIDYNVGLLLGVAAALGPGLAFGMTSAFGQSALTSGDELRPLYATSSDVAEGKQLADLSCSNCHGAGGVSTTERVPNLAGQRPSYLYLKLKADQRSGSDEPHSVKLMKFLSDDALADVAAYYATLDPASPPDAPAPTWADPIAAGKIAAEPCAKCHGENGVSHKAGVPSLIGLHPKYLVETMQAYKSGDRPIGPKNEDMKKALEALGDQDLQHVALYYALQRENLTPAQTPNDGGAPPTKEALATCAKCHGDGGISTTPITPSLAGQDAAYAFNALRAYKDGTREDDAMSPKTKKLDDVEMKNFAAYFAGLDPKPVNILKPLSPDEWAEKCDRCHGVNGNSARPEVPALAAQRPDYLESALRKYRSGARKSSEMAAMSSILTEEDIAGIAAHYAHQKPRAAVFVPVPSK
ncbi:MAG: c-type cytochrome [Hyphomicrobiales bacterium]|nr:c-type cytochrome [Hyphomicrobiales bacterium]